MNNFLKNKYTPFYATVESKFVNYDERKIKATDEWKKWKMNESTIFYTYKKV